MSVAPPGPPAVTTRTTSTSLNSKITVNDPLKASGAWVCMAYTKRSSPLLKRCQVDRRQRQRRIGGLRLGLSVQQLAADSLELPTDGELTCVQINIGPGEAEDLSLTQAEYKYQHVGGVERVVLAAH